MSKFPNGVNVSGGNAVVAAATTVSVGVTSYSITGGVWTITTSTPHGMVTSDKFSVVGYFSPNILLCHYPGSYFTVASTPDGSTLTFPVLLSPADCGTTPITGTIARSQQSAVFALTSGPGGTPFFQVAKAGNYTQLYLSRNDGLPNLNPEWMSEISFQNDVRLKYYTVYGFNSGGNTGFSMSKMDSTGADVQFFTAGATAIALGMPSHTLGLWSPITIPIDHATATGTITTGDTTVTASSHNLAIQATYYGTVQANQLFLQYNSLVGINNGAPAGQLHVLAYQATTSGLIVEGFVSQTVPLVLLRGTDSTTASMNMAIVDAAWANSTHASRTGRLVLSAADYTGTNKEGLRIEANGTAVMLGLFGATAVVQPASASDGAIGALATVALTDSTGGTAATTLAAIADPATANAIASLAAQLAHVLADLTSLKTLANQLRADLVALGAIKGSA